MSLTDGGVGRESSKGCIFDRMSDYRGKIVMDCELIKTHCVEVYRRSPLLPRRRSDRRFRWESTKRQRERNRMEHPH